MTTEVYNRIKSLIESHEVWLITQDVLDLAKDVSEKISQVGPSTPMLCADKIVFHTPFVIELHLKKSVINQTEVSHEDTIGMIEKLIGQQ